MLQYMLSYINNETQVTDILTYKQRINNILQLWIAEWIKTAMEGWRNQQNTN